MNNSMTISKRNSNWYNLETGCKMGSLLLQLTQNRTSIRKYKMRNTDQE